MSARDASSSQIGATPHAHGMRPHDWAAFVAVASAIVSAIALAGGAPAWAAGCAVSAVASGMYARTCSTAHPGPMPYRIRWLLFLPRGMHTPQRLIQILEPHAGERILEVGPGVGIHSLPVARSLEPGGVLEALDVQQQMLDEVSRRAERAGVTGIVTTRGNAEELPYVDHSFDGAYLIGVLGEIPDANRALREIARVLKPKGRLVIGEVVLDPDYVPPARVKEIASTADLLFERRLGSALCYLACFRPAPRSRAA